MNVENLKALATHLRRPEMAEHFWMGEWWYGLTSGPTRLEALHACGTVACIAGHAAALAGDEDGSSWWTESPKSKATSWLELTEEQSLALFMPDLPIEWRYRQITSEMAVRVVELLVATGTVNWGVVCHER